MKKNYNFCIFLFLFSFAVRLITISVFNTPIESDFKLMYDAALEIINGTNNYLTTPYFISWGYQMGHVLYQVFLLSIINSPFFLKIINCIITSLIPVMIFLISNLFSKDSYSKIGSLLYSIFPFPVLLNTVLTNQHLPILLTLIAIYLLLRMDFKSFWFKSIVIGLLLGWSNILRSEGIVFIFSVFLYYIFLIFKKVKLKSLLISFLLIFVSYSLIFDVTSYAIRKTNLSVNGLENMNTTWKFVLGFNYETNGMYSEEDANIYAHDVNKSKDIVILRLKDYKKIPILFLKKVKILWFNSDISWSLGHIYNSLIYKVLNIINQFFIILFNFFTIISACNLLKKKLPSNEQFFITAILCVFFGVYLLIEIMPRYAYSLQIFEAILFPVGLNVLISNIKTNLINISK